jgi:hypothetical protein
MSNTPLSDPLHNFTELSDKLLAALGSDRPKGQCMALYDEGNKALKVLTKAYHRLALDARKADDEFTKGSKRDTASKDEAKRQDDKKSTRKAEKTAAREAARKEPREKYTRTEASSDEPRRFPSDGDDTV